MILQLLKDFNIRIDSNALCVKNYEQWLKNPEHGMVHGYLVAFFACYIGNPNRRLIITCLIHDCLKCAGREPHDKLLYDEYRDLDPVAYTHSNPTPSDTHNPLIIGDRLELMRYPDYKSWIKMDMLKLLFPLEELEDFFNDRRFAEEIIRDKWV